MIKQTKVKPIFKEEKEYLENKLGIELPKDCWTRGGGTRYVFLDIYSKIPYIKFVVHDNGKYEIIKDNRERLKKYKSKGISETLDYERDRINDQWNNDIKRTVEFVAEHRDIPYNISISGGKDSEVLYNLWKEVLTKLDFMPEYEFIFFNTSNEVPEVYRYIKERKDIRIINPQIGWHQYIKDKGYLLPTVFNRFCCSVYKEGQVKKQYDNKSARVQVIGMRTNESVKRSRYSFYMDYDFEKKLYGSSNIPQKWVKLCPLIDWTTTDIWLIVLIKRFFVNQKYKNGFQRVGCNICPYSSPYEDDLNRHYYPHLWHRFEELARQSYRLHQVAQISGYTEQEYINGIWKHQKSKSLTYLNKKPTDENIQAFADYKGLSFEMAKKFWNRICGECGKKMNPTEISMFYKIDGRKENEEDNRKPICKKCFCKKNNLTDRQYFQMAKEFKDSGCNLF